MMFFLESGKEKGDNPPSAVVGIVLARLMALSTAGIVESLRQYSQLSGLSMRH
jgi:hypothetical protein